MTKNNLPVAVIGAGPVGLAAASHLLEKGLQPIVFERGPSVGTAIAEWAHVRIFSPWEYNVDQAARRLLETDGWQMPDPDYIPTGGELIDDYLAPLAAHPAITPTLRFEAEVLKVTRLNRSKLASENREETPFVVLWRDKLGEMHRTRARAVIDASGTWATPNPIGLDGLPIEGETENADYVTYGIPDILGKDRAAYAGKRTLVIGAGHSAINAALDLFSLQDQAPDTKISWATRSGGIERVLGGGLNDQLPSRGALGVRAVEALRSGQVTFRSPFAAERIEKAGDGITVHGFEGELPVTFEVDRIIVATGFRPDLSIISELRIELDPIVEATPALAPLIDPNLHSCGTVRPHGVEELSHPEKDFFIVGMKSYGRAPTFLMTTGYEQVRSIIAELSGDPIAARQVQLKLPETGVCKIGTAGSADGGCCGETVEPQPAIQLETASSCCAPERPSVAAASSDCGCQTQ